MYEGERIEAKQELGEKDRWFDDEKSTAASELDESYIP